MACVGGSSCLWFNMTTPLWRIAMPGAGAARLREGCQELSEPLGVLAGIGRNFPIRLVRSFEAVQKIVQLVRRYCAGDFIVAHSGSDPAKHTPNT